MEIGGHGQFTQEHCCSKCGHPLVTNKAGLVVSLRTLSGDSAQVGITMREQQMVEVLLRSYPELAPHDQMFLRVWGYDSDVQEKTMHVYVCKLRKKLKVVGFGLETIFGVGYKLVKHVA